MHYLRGHPHSKNKQRERGGVQPSAYDCVQGGGGGGGGRFQGGVPTQKKFFGPQILKTSFFVQKKILLLCIDKCKLALSYK